MRITTPQMGTIKYMLEDLVKRLGAEYQAPPKTSVKTLEIGSRYSPEFSCLPFKITLGNFMEALDKGTDLLVMAGGCGPCRFGYYAEIQKKILQDLGYDFDMAVAEPPRAHPIQFVRAFKKMAPHMSVPAIWNAIKISFKKAQLFDLAEKKLLKLRAYEIRRGDSDKAYEEAVAAIRETFAEEEIDACFAEIDAIYDKVPVDMSRNVLKIGLVGEFYMMLEPVVNFDVERWLGARNIHIERSVYTSDWIGPNKSNPVSGFDDTSTRKEANDYLSHTVGGEGQLTIGHVIHFAKQGFDGVIHLFPFTCMPETIAKSILPKVSRDYDMPVLSLVIDEQTGKAGVTTRLEALLDLMQSRRERTKEAPECAVI